MAKGEVHGPFTLPSQAYPGTQHTYWVYVPAQYNTDVPASLMIFNDGQAFKNMEGDLRVPNVLDNLIDRRELPVMLAVFINPGPHAGTAGADAAGMGRQDDEPADRIQHARRQVRARHRRRADAGALQGVQHLEGSGAPRHRRRELRRHRGVHRRVGAPNEFRKVLSLIGSFTNIRGGHAYADIVRKSEKKPIRIYMQDGRNDNRGVGRGGTYDPLRDWFLQNVRLKDALAEKGYDLDVTSGASAATARSTAARSCPT